MSQENYKNIFDTVMIELIYRMNRYNITHIEIGEEIPEFLDIWYFLEHIKYNF